MQESPLQPNEVCKGSPEKRLTEWSIFSFEFHRKRIVLSCGAESLLKKTFLKRAVQKDLFKKTCSKMR
jgi:hypothetical protein